MCPICRKNGGFLPVHKNFNLIKGIHAFKEPVVKEPVVKELVVKEPITKSKSNKSNIIDINPNKLPHECGVKLKTKNGYCECSAKLLYGGFCGRHANYITTHPPTPIVNNNKIADINDPSPNNLPDDGTLII